MRTVAAYLLIGATLSWSVTARDLQVNIRLSDDQAAPAIAADANGNFVVVCTSYYSDKSNEIHARLFDSSGAAVSDELQINQTQPGNQKAPAVAMDHTGNFTVIWQGPGSDGNDIWCRRFDANANALGDEFIVNTNTADQQYSPNIAINNTGLHIIVWESNGVPHPGARAICGRVFDSNASTVGPELVLSDGNDICRFPAVALSNAGKAVVAWVRDSATQEIRKRAFAADGNEPFFNSVKINDSPNLNSLTRPAIAMDSAGNYIIAWDGHPNDHDRDDIYFRAFHWSGAWHDQYRINDGNDGAQRNPVILLYDNGPFTVLWEGDSPDQLNKRNIFGQCFVMDFEQLIEPEKIGDQFTMNTYLYDDQRNTAACRTTDDAFVAAWQSSGQDTSGEGIYACLGPIIGSADLDGDGFINFADYSLLAAQWLQQTDALDADLVNDNQIDSKDLLAFSRQWLTYRYSCAQTNLDEQGPVNFTDFAILAAGWKNYGPLDGDIDKNGTVDEHDLHWLTLHWTAHPE